MAKVGAQRAATLTGKSKSTIQRAMNSGKISFELDANGRRLIDVSELERVYGLEKSNADLGNPDAVQETHEKTAQLLETERLKMRIKILEDQIESAQGQIDDLKAQRDQWQKQASQVLLTSQYSQKQAEELKAQIEERDRKIRERRRQQLEKQNAPSKPTAVKTLRPGNQNRSAPQEDNFNFRGFWQKVKNFG